MPLTRKQQNALRAMPKGRRAAALQQYRRQDARNGQMVVRSRADRVLAQGVGAYPARAFGSMSGMSMCGWDAFHPMHLPLPRGIGAYTVLRTTGQISTKAKALVFGPMQVTRTIPSGGNYQEPAYWSNIVGISSNPGNAGTELTVDIGSDNGCNFLHIPEPIAPINEFADGGRVVPAAFSIQILNPEALQTTNGIISGAVSHAPINWGGAGSTWETRIQQSMAYMRPRLMSAGKLALRGVQTNSYPLDMSKCAEFTGMFRSGAEYITTGKWTSNIVPQAWAPTLVFNPQGVELNYLITIEWRVRFPLDNPAVSSHVKHKATPDHVWDGFISKATALGNGVVDIVEKVASIGNAVGGAVEAVGRATGRLPHLPMIVD